MPWLGVMVCYVFVAMAIFPQHAPLSFSFVFIFRFCLIYNFCFFFHAKAKRSHQSQLLCMVACFTVVQHLSKHWKEFARSLSKLSLDLRSAVWFVSAALENAYIPPVSCAGWCVSACLFWSSFSSHSRFHSS